MWGIPESSHPLFILDLKVKKKSDCISKLTFQIEEYTLMSGDGASIQVTRTHHHPHECLCWAGYLSVTAVPIISHIQVLWYVVCTQNFKVLETFPSFSVRQGDPTSLKGKYEASLSFERVIEPCLQWVPFVCSAHTSHFLERNGLPANDISQFSKCMVSLGI